MSDFLPAYEAMILAEGGYKLHTVPGDTGGMTYAGIARNKNPQWAGWAFLDRGETPPTQMVRDFYRAGWWAPLRGDDLQDQRIAQAIFSFGVNSSAYGRPTVAAKLAQIVVGVTPDGFIGDKSVAAINGYHPELFLAQYALAKVARYRDICMKNRSQTAFLLGWVNRVLKESV
jgi:lysozyme family protein